MHYKAHDFDQNPEAYGSNASYRSAIIHCAEAVLRLHFAEKLVNKVFGRNLQSHAAGLVLVMHCEAVLGLGPRPTLGLVQREMGSPRTLAAFFGLLRLAGYLTQEPVPGDGRSTWLVPSPQLFDGLRQWLSHHARCCEIVGFAEAGFSERLRTDEAWLRLYLAHARSLLAKTREAMAGDGAWAWFDRFDCGDRVGLILLRAHHESAAEAGEGPNWFPLGGREIAARLGISHSHIRNIVNQADVAGLVLQDRAGGRIALTPRFLSESEAWFRTFWSWIAETGQTADSHVARQR